MLKLDMEIELQSEINKILSNVISKTQICHKTQIHFS